MLLDLLHWILARPASQLVLVVKNLPVNTGDLRDVGSVLDWEDPLEKQMATHSSILAWKISRTEESGRLQSIGSDESDTTEAT